MLKDVKGCLGYEMFFGECGVCLFGGQCQWIVLVCVILKDVLIFVLDEVILVFDFEVEVLIQVLLDMVMVGKIVLVIVYCLLMLVSMDWIIVLDQGQIVEDGMYFDLFDWGGVYVKFWQCQLGGFIGVEVVEQWFGLILCKLL